MCDTELYTMASITYTSMKRSFKLLKLMCRFNQRICSVIIVLFSIAVIIYVLKLDENRWKPTTMLHKDNRSDKTVKLLLWTTWFMYDWPIPDKVWEIQCANQKIHVYRRKHVNDISEMDAILFHLMDIIPFSLPQKDPNQKWILFNLETYLSLFIWHRLDIQMIQDKIDWVMSFRRDADIFTPYGFVAQSEQSFNENQLNRVAVDLGQKQRFVYGTLKNNKSEEHSPLKKKKKQIAWIVSHCNAYSNRQLFVKELSNYIEVDIYGACGPFKCPEHIDCKEFVAQEYNFYLSMENSLCNDYITEKLYDAFIFGSLPILFADTSLAKYLPKNSYIDALSFKSPKELANYLHLVSNNQSLYVSYFQWKSSYKIFSQTHDSYFCSVSDALLEQRESRKDHNLLKWFYEDAHCRRWESKSDG